jgi:hypothetical protein
MLHANAKCVNTFLYQNVLLNQGMRSGSVDRLRIQAVGRPKLTTAVSVRSGADVPSSLATIKDLAVEF